jgi:hypothetical protein
MLGTRGKRAREDGDTREVEDIVKSPTPHQGTATETQIQDTLEVRVAAEAERPNGTPLAAEVLEEATATLADSSPKELSQPSLKSSM